ncbi:hypothetical protein, partial [Caecibacteroides pullorum]|uniref:hypothetical protein n=1 Tax=Caecibacteroides pullorum TaxID=2725562 RepID=UPI00195666C7
MDDIRFISSVMNSLCLVVGIFCSAMMDPNSTFRSLFFSFSLDFYHCLVSMLFIIRVLCACEIICEITEELISLISVKQITNGEGNSARTKRLNMRNS